MVRLFLIKTQMKKLYSLLLLFLFPINQLLAQNIQLMAGREYKLVVEAESIGENHFRYAYVDATFDTNLRKDISIAAFIQIIAEQKWWKPEIYLHGEFRTGLTNQFSFSNTYLAGVAYKPLATEKGHIVVEGLFRYEKSAPQWQFTLVSGAYHKRWLFTNYIDIYGQNNVSLFSENKLFFNIYKPLYIGVNFELSYNVRQTNQFAFYPFGIIRFNL